MRESEILKIELISLSNTLKDFIEENRDKMSSKSILIHDLREIGFTKIGANKWAFDLKIHDISYVSFMLIFRGNAIDLTEDHIIIIDGKEEPLSSIRKPYTLTAVRYSRVIKELLSRVKALGDIFKNGDDYE